VTAAIDRLGHHAKTVLGVACVAGGLALGAVLSRRTPVELTAGAVVASAVAGALDPRHPAASDVAIVAILGGLVTLATAIAGTPSPNAAADDSRRRLLALIVWGGAWTILGAGYLRHARRHVLTTVVRVDQPAHIADDRALDQVDGLSPAVTSRTDHYTVDIDLDKPAVDPSTWRLRLDGAVGHPQAWTLDDLRSMPTIERVMAMSCISNPVGGRLVGNARWTGVPLARLLRIAGPTPLARFVQARAADGYYDTLPVPADGDEEVLVAFGMDGFLLTLDHGFPARLRVPDRYGVKNVKWLTDLVVLEADRVGYWGERGWDPIAEVHISSRIDTPTQGAVVTSSFTVAGVAWSAGRFISRVEVSADDGRSWLAAHLEPAGDPLSWRRWWLTLALPDGAHALTVRAVDGLGRLQTADREPAHPGGSTGWHRIVVQVGALSR
jgi:DMSO/TMAO reductase YedYZ molybdopterin-dependent catalytic subunit